MTGVLGLGLGRGRGLRLARMAGLCLSGACLSGVGLSGVGLLVVLGQGLGVLIRLCVAGGACPGWG